VLSCRNNKKAYSLKKNRHHQQQHNAKRIVAIQLKPYLSSPTLRVPRLLTTKSNKLVHASCSEAITTTSASTNSKLDGGIDNNCTSRIQLCQRSARRPRATSFAATAFSGLGHQIGNHFKTGFERAKESVVSGRTMLVC